MERSTPTLSPGELQRLHLATQIRSNLFGVVYVLDEPTAGLHPADSRLLRALDQLRRSGNSLFVVEHDLDVMRRADWLADVGPAAGAERGGQILYSGAPAGLRATSRPPRRRATSSRHSRPRPRAPRAPTGWLEPRGVTRNNPRGLDARFPLGVFTTVTGVSGSGKSSLVSQALVELVCAHLGHEPAPAEEEDGEGAEQSAAPALRGHIHAGVDGVRRLVRVDQRPTSAARRARTWRPTLASSIRCASSSPRRGPRARAATTRGASRSTSPGALRELRGRGLRQRRAALPPQRLRALPHLPRRALQRADVAGHLADRSIADVLRMTVDEASGLLRRGGERAAAARVAARHRPGLPAAGAARDRALRWRGPAHQAGDGVAAHAARQHALRAGRADLWPAPRRRGQADGAAPGPGGRATRWWWWSTSCA